VLIEPQADNLIGSGQEVVVAQAIYALVGAVALERGGEVANGIARQRILEPLGVTFPADV
jgi:large subunit ribosomal protein L15